MAVTATQQREFIKVGIGLYGAALGSTYLNLFAQVSEAGFSIGQIYEALMADPFSQQANLYPLYLTNEQFAARLVSFATGGTLTGDAKSQAEALVLGKLNAAPAGQAITVTRGEAAKYFVDLLDAAVDTDPVFGTVAKLFDNRVTVAQYYSVDKGLSSSSLTTLQTVVSGVNSTTNVTGTAALDAAIAPSNPVVSTGQTFALTAGVDNITGSAGDDTIVGDLAFNNTTAAYDTPTLGVFDVINGGAGTDTLNITQLSAAAYTLPAASISNVENLVIKNSNGAVTADVSAATGMTAVTVTQGTAADVDVTTKGNVTAVTITKAATSPTVTDSGTTATDKLATVNLIGNTADVAISSDALTAVSLKSTGFGATVTAAAANRTLTVSLDGVTGGTVTDAEATTLAVKSSGAQTTGITLAAAKATTVSLDVAATTTASVTTSATITDIQASAATGLTVTGAGAVTIAALTAPTKLASVDASGNTGGVTITPALGTGVAFTGGTGKDSVSVTAGNTKAIATGAGDDTVTMTGAVGTGGSVNGGDGTDTLSMTFGDATTVSATTTFKAGISNFEKVKIDAVTTTNTATVQLANLNDINYVVSAGTSGGTAGTTETSSVVFSGLKIGQSATVGGVTVTASGTADLTAAQVASAFSGTTVTGATKTGSYTGFTAAAPSGGGLDTVVFTATTAGNVTNFDNVAASVTNIAAPTAPVVTTTQGVAAVTESSVVTFGSLNAGEVATAAGKTVTAAAAVTESASIVFTALTAGQALTIGGMTVTSAAGAASATDLAQTFKTGISQNGDLTVTGMAGIAGYTGAGAADTIVFTSTTPNANVTDLASSGTGAAKGAITVTQGFNGVVTAAEVATAMATGGVSIAGKLTVGGALSAAFTTSAAAGNAVTFTSATASSNVTDIVVSSTGNQPTVATTQGAAAVTESSSIVFSGLKAGQSVTIGDLTLTATGADLTADQVAEAMDGNDGVGFAGAATTAVAAAVLSGVGATAKVPTGFTAGAITSGATVVYTSTTAGSNVTDITPTTVANIAAATAPIVTNTNGGVGAAAGGTLNITGYGAAGTLELTNVISGASSVTLANSTGTADVFNIKLNGAANLVNTAALSVANVETINIEATDSSSDTTTLTNPAAASTIMLNAANATAITVKGNHGVDFTGSTLTAVTSLDATGVVSVGNAAGATSTQIGTTGAVTFSSVVNNKAVTVTTGNGADVISVASINDATFLATGATAGTVTTGAGNDTITGSAGKDVIDAGAGNDVITGGARADTITTGAGNDRVVLTAASESTLANKDVITDFTANTYGNGTSGAAGTGAAIASATSFTGDVIDLRSFITGAITKVSVAVVATESAATVSLQNVGDATTDTIAIALDSTTGNVYMDVNSDGVADSVIQLTGVTTLTNAAFLVA